MNRKNPPAAPKRPAVLIEALEPRIAPAGLLNESKFTSVAVGGSLLLDASGKPGAFQGLTTGAGGGSGSYLLYLTSGRALVFTTDINGNGRLDPGEITGISLGKDSLGHDPSLLLFSDVNGDIVTNLDGTAGATLTDSDHNPNNGRDGQLLTDTNIGSITLRTLTNADIDATIAGNTTLNRLALTSFSIHGNVVAGGSIGGVTIDTVGTALLTAKFDGSTGDQLFTGAVPTIGGLYTGTAANNLSFHFTQNNPNTPQIEGTIQLFRPSAGEHGGDISNVQAASTGTVFSIGTLATGDGGTGAPGGNLTNLVLHGAEGGYQVIAGNGGDGAIGGVGGSISGFNDLGSVTSDVVLHTGDGGTGLLGAGGNGGTATFATTNIAAGVHVYMGRGGDGFTNGGTGASFTSAAFNTPETTTPIGNDFIGTWHNIGDVGNTHPLPDGTYAPEVLDFNHDGFGDAIFTTNVPNAVNIVFGNGLGALNGTTVSLKVPGVTNPAVTVGDFNGDGRPDIAVASGDASSFSGVYVFLDQIGTALDPINSRNFTHSTVGDHPFSAPLQTALPTLADQFLYQTSGAVVALAAGDYNGDGITDIAYIQNVIVEVTFQPLQTVGVLFGDARHDPNTGAVGHDATTGKIIGSGYFYANSAAPKAAPTLQNVFNLPGTVFLQATSLTSGNLPNAVTGLPAANEIFLYTKQGEKSFTSYSVSPTNPVTHAPFAAGLAPAPFGLGQVDTNRNLGGTNVSSTDAQIQALTIQDIDRDGFADVVVLTQTPQSFLLGFQGDRLNGFTNRSAPNADNAGIAIQNTGNGVALAASDPVGTGDFNAVGILLLPQIPGPFVREYLFQDPVTRAPSFYYNNGDPTAARTLALGTDTQDTNVATIDGFYATTPLLSARTGAAARLSASGFGVLSPETTAYQQANLYLLGTGSILLSFPYYETNNGYEIRSGDGGNAVTGIGGNAGVVGSLTAQVGGGTGAVAIVFPASPTYLGDASVIGGNGGNGYGGGGIGGDTSGITVRYVVGAIPTSVASLTAGNGGNGIGGDGGRGGNLSLDSIQTQTDFVGTAGNAGNGLHGGQGGSITGNQSGVYDVATVSVTLITGIGGEGALAGGIGGDINKWDSLLTPKTGTLGSFLTYTTGAGGGAAGGSGGNGGSILDSSPDQNQNSLSGPLTLTTGAGGNGLAGGNGGAVNTFINSATSQSALPTTLSVLTGNGGIGVSGVGGAGGLITSFSSNATGLLSNPLNLNPLVGLGRIIAGDGGASYGQSGGNGGTLNNVTATATSTPLVVAGGAGGDGLTLGGTGGSVTNSQINSAALQIGKMLVVGGKGGNALAAQPQDITLVGDSDTTDLAHTVLAFGNVRGVGGNGGNISNITQPVGAQTAVDLIAGNGGSTINASTVTTPTTGVGAGGSVTGVTLTGTVGAISRDTTLGAVTNPPIKSYSFLDRTTGTTNTSISALIDFLAQPDNTGFVLDDSVGNVGIVAGSAGLVRGARPAQDGVNGDVTNITASSIMSIVAGSVDRVAPVRILSGIAVTNTDGVLGADKRPIPTTLPNGQLSYGPNGVLDYFNPTTNQVVNNLEAGDGLIDGAIFSSSNQQTGLQGPRIFSAT